MPKPKNVGSIIYTDDYEADVWFYPDDNHIFILADTSQIGDFPVNQPCRADPQQIAADYVYRQWLKTGCSQKAFINPIDDDVVIENIYMATFGRQTLCTRRH